MVEVVVTLDAPPLASAAASDRRLASASFRRGRLNVRTPASVSYLRRLAAAQRTLQGRIAGTIPSARFRWRYTVVLNGMAVVVPERDLARLESLSGVSQVYPSVRYGPLLDRGVPLVKAPALWGPDLATAGDGIKIGIVDDGVDENHPFFAPARFTMPAGFPKGAPTFASAKVIVARAFPPASPKWRHAAKPFDPVHSIHGTHVAGIAAGNNNTRTSGGTRLSGVAPRAYIGNYKVLTVPTASGVGLNGNSPEIAAGIEAAVRDGMDVINLSLGEPEIEPSRDLVVRAINAAADAGVVPAVAAGNDFEDFGGGSLISPGSAQKAITAGAVTAAARPTIGEFSSGGPTPVSLLLKPDVSAPGVGILSSVPGGSGVGFYTSFSGTSMAAPHVAGGAALLRQRHPTWTVAQIKSALMLTGTPVGGPDPADQEPTTRQGGGVIDLQRADNALLFASPSSISLGLVRAGATATQNVELSDAGGGAGDWTVTLERQLSVPGTTVTVPPAVTVPGTFAVVVTVASNAPQRELTGFVVLTRGAEARRVPYWLRVNRPVLSRKIPRPLPRAGVFDGDTRKASALIASYRYPDDPSGTGVSNDLRGPEQVFRFKLRRPAANFGVAIVARRPGVTVEPRIVRAGDENRQLGHTTLPVNFNPYLPGYRRVEPVSGVILPAAGSYDVVFDSPSRSGAGRYRFRFWIGDTRPPQLTLLSRSVPLGGSVRVRATDGGSGVNPRSVFAVVDGRDRIARYNARRALVTVPLGGLARGRHRLVLQVSDYQESKNMENVSRILPNTRTLATTFVVR